MLSDFSNLVVPTPIPIPTDQPQGNHYNQAMLNLPGTHTQGADIITHLQLSIRARINLEWCSKTILQLSNTAAYTVQQPWVLDYLLGELQTQFDKTSALSLRNLSQDTEFTQLLAQNSKTKKILADILKNFADEPCVADSDPKFANIDNELLIYTIDIVESVSSYYAPLPKDDEIFLYLTKIFGQRDDRSLLISIMRSFARFLVRSESTDDNCASNFSSQIFDRITSFLLTEDHDLILTSLDFLYQYCLPGNARISHLLRSSTRQDILRSRLPQLLTFQQNIDKNPNDFAHFQPLRLVKRTKPPIPTTAPKLTPEHYRQISLLSEPLRATAWMRCCYRFVPEGEVTQISLWKAYEQQFEKDVTKKKLLPAVDFIKNVSQAFTNSNAMVINLANGQRKFIIKGIEPRFSSVDIKTGDFEAFGEASHRNENSKVVSEFSEQEQIPEYTPPISLNDVNSSTVMLLTSLTNNAQGKELFKPLLEELLKRVEAMPELLDELVDVLKYLQD
jgi:chromatin structure-remodeling complex subunit RSC9